MTLEVKVLKHVISPAQEKVFQDLAAGLSYEQVAAKHHRTAETVKSHAKVIREEFHAKTMIEAVAKAIARGVITITEVGGKTMIAIALVGASWFVDDGDMLRATRTAGTTKIARRIDEA